MLSNIAGICGCAPCEEAIINNTIPTAVGLSTIYFGRSTDITLTEVQVLAMPSISQSNFAGTYSFGAVVPSNRCHVLYPVALGLPSAIIDVNSGFDFDVIEPFATLSILGESYYDVVSENDLGGAVKMQLNQ